MRIIEVNYMKLISNLEAKEYLSELKRSFDSKIFLKGARLNDQRILCQACAA